MSERRQNIYESSVPLESAEERISSALNHDLLRRRPKGFWEKLFSVGLRGRERERGGKTSEGRRAAAAEVLHQQGRGAPTD